MSDTLRTGVDAGAYITVGGYNGTIAATGLGNPLSGRAAWVNTSVAGWAQVSVNLLAYRGPSFTFRLRLGSDIKNVGAPGGWWVDDVQVSYDAPLPSCGQTWSAASPYPGGAAATGRREPQWCAVCIWRTDGWRDSERIPLLD